MFLYIRRGAWELKAKMRSRFFFVASCCSNAQSGSQELKCCATDTFRVIQYTFISIKTVTYWKVCSERTMVLDGLRSLPYNYFHNWLYFSKNYHANRQSKRICEWMQTQFIKAKPRSWLPTSCTWLARLKKATLSVHRSHLHERVCWCF